MINKKSRSADLEKKRFAFFQIGLIIVAAVTLVAFEYTTLHEKKKMVELMDDFTPIYTTPIIEIDAVPQQRPRPVQDNVMSVRAEVVDEVTITNKFVDPNTLTTKTGVSITGVPDGDVLLDSLILEPEPIVDVPDVEASFPGGPAAMAQFMKDNTKVPDVIRDLGRGGIVYMEFVVNTDGTIVDVVAKNSADAALVKEAKRVVELMPDWIPGQKKGKAVRSRFIIPFNFIVK